ncbi:MAG TPA: hypothetical protein VIN08_17815 [Ohtaekwangia sp.]|uniref:hypothetical protein n=1 Tax=Ohtaekwangia sp. TaxID=2066019 RepID=UPI002F950857
MLPHLKKKYISGIVIACAGLLLAVAGYGQQPTGFYFTVECTKYTSKPRIVTLSDKKMQVCITDQPVVTIDGFEVVSELMEIQEKNFAFFDVTLTDKAFQTLKKLSATFSLKNLVFIIDNEVVFLFEMEASNPTRVFRITGTYHSRDVQRIYEKLRTFTASKE